MAEVLFATAIFVVVIGVVTVASNTLINSSKSSNTSVQQYATSRMAVTTLSDDIVKSGMYSIGINQCAEECVGKKVSFKIPIVDNFPDSPIQNSMYTPDGRVKFGAYYDTGSGIIGRQDCRYVFMRTDKNQPDGNQLQRKVICEDAQCGRHGCQQDIQEDQLDSPNYCPVDCGGCGDGICDPNNPLDTPSCRDCWACGNNVCEPGERCGESDVCIGDCNHGAVCQDKNGNPISN